MNSIREIHIWNLYLPLLESQQQIIYEQIHKSPIWNIQNKRYFQMSNLCSKEIVDKDSSVSLQKEDGTYIVFNTMGCIKIFQKLNHIYGDVSIKAVCRIFTKREKSTTQTTSPVSTFIIIYQKSQPEFKFQYGIHTFIYNITSNPN